MSIIAILSLITATALFSGRDQYYSNQAAEIAVSAIRESQNKAISFMQSEIGAPTKVWGVSFSEADNSIKLISIEGEGGANSAGYNHEEGLKEIGVGVTLDTDSINNVIYVYYAAPFGTPYVMNNECNTWAEGNKPSREYEPGCTYLTAGEKATVSFDYKGHIFNVEVNNKGVASVK